MSKKNNLLLVLSYVVLAILAYSNSFQNSFTFDDWNFIVRSKFIKDLQNIQLFLSTDYLKLSPMEVDLQRPFMTLSLMIDYYVWELNPLGYHVTNVLLHAINSVEVFYLLFVLIPGNYFPAIIAAIIFAIHPIHTEAVNSISFREDLLVTLFYLGSLIFFLKGLKSIRKKYFMAATVIFYTLALLSKEMALTLPLVIFIVHISIKKTLIPLIKEKWFYSIILTISVFYFVFLLSVAGSLEQSISGMYGVAKFKLSLPIISSILFYYCQLIIFPVNLTAIHDFPRYASLLETNALASAVVIVLIIFVGLYFIKSKPILSLFIYWFFITILPVSGVIPIVDPVAERYLYLPSIGPIALFGLAIGGMWQAKRTYALIIFISLLVLLFSLTFKRNEVWREDYTLWKDAAKRAPWNYFAHQSLGMAAYKKGNTEEAISALKDALALKPNAAISSEIYYDLGLIYKAMGMDSLAIESLKSAVDLNPNDIRAIYALNSIFKNQNENRNMDSDYSEGKPSDSR